MAAVLMFVFVPQAFSTLSLCRGAKKNIQRVAKKYSLVSSKS